MNRPYSSGLALVCAVMLTVLSPASLKAQSTLAEAQTPPRYVTAIEFARTLMTAVMEESGTPGMSVAVGIDGRIVWAEGFGWADVENGVPVRAETKFRIGSVSKPVTAAAVGLLVEQGKLDLDAPIQTYVPTFPEKRWPLTTRQVAGHLGGIRHYANDSEFLSAKRYDTVLEGLTIFQDDTLLFEPGERFSYSSYGWNLISAVIEGASGEGFLSYIQKNVFDPIGMTHTAADYTDSIIPDRTRFYDRAEDRKVLNAPYVDNSYKWAGGGFISTPSDLVHFGFAHFGEDLLNSRTISELWTPQRTNAGESTGYGIGWGVAVEDGVVTVASHGGGSVGGTTGFITRPPEKAVVAIVGNMSQAPTGGLLPQLIMQAFLEPEALESEGSSLDITGEQECALTRGGEELIRGTGEISETRDGYWGRWDWSNGTSDEVVYSVTGAEGVTLYIVDGAGRVTRFTYTSAEGSQLNGEFQGGGRGELICTRN